MPALSRLAGPALLLLLCSAARADELSVGVMVDAGLPDGVQGALTYKPAGWLRLHAGGGHNYIAPGVRAGISLVPLALGVQPALVFEAGRYFEGDANPLMRQLSRNPDYYNEGMSRVGYDWASAHVGLEVGSARARMTFHAGYSYIDTRVRDAGALVGDGDGSLRFGADPRVHGWVPSARIGFLVHLF